VASDLTADGAVGGPGGVVRCGVLRLAQRTGVNQRSKRGR
jgi:hypothetical protein